MNATSNHAAWYFVLVLIAVPALVALAGLIATLRGVITMPGLARVPIAERDTWPRVTMVVAACDEQESVGDALKSSLERAAERACSS